MSTLSTHQRSSVPCASSPFELRHWLEDFAACVRSVDYDRAGAMFAEDAVGFGTFARMLVGRENLIEGQWRKIWDCTRGFHFLIDEAHLEAHGDIAWIATPWTSQGRDESGNWYDRSGRCTLVLKRLGGRWLCVHSHYSRQPAPKQTDGIVTPA